MEEKIVSVLNEMADYLNISQMKKLQEVMLKAFAQNAPEKAEIRNEEYLKMFLDAKRIEGCSDRTIDYYSKTISHMIGRTDQSVRKITTEDMREYLADYQKINNCSNVTVNNIRRNISSFFSWLEEEDYILKSPMKRIHKIKTKKVVKTVISDEAIEKLRDNCLECRDLAIIDLLYSTGMRVGELVNLNVDDIDLERRECVVYGKGGKERTVPISAELRRALSTYIAVRDRWMAGAERPCKALFLSVQYRQQLTPAGVWSVFAKSPLTGERISPHTWRHTFGRCWILNGGSIVSLQQILGHSDIATTRKYIYLASEDVAIENQQFNPLSNSKWTYF